MHTYTTEYIIYYIFIYFPNYLIKLNTNTETFEYKDVHNILTTRYSCQMTQLFKIYLQFVEY